MSKKHKGRMLTVKHLEYPVLSEFTVLHKGWESDNTAFIVQDGDKKRIAFTSHGTPYFPTPKQLRDQEELTADALISLRAAMQTVETPR